jgi:glutathione S-transferase
VLAHLGELSLPEALVSLQQSPPLPGLTLAAIGKAAETNGNLACREITLGDLAVAAHLSTLDYFGEVPWHDFAAANEWYVRMKSRPAFRSILSDRVPGQPPVSHYAELDF